MAGFNYDLGRSNNMIEAESRGLVTIGRWAKRYGVSAAAAVEIMSPSEAHHTGTGRRGKSRLTPVIEADCEPTSEQLDRMRAFDVAAKAEKAAPPRMIGDCVARYLTFPAWRAKSRRPTEHVELLRVVEVFADGKIAALQMDCRRTTGWHKRAGLVIAKDGEIVHAKVDETFDNPVEITQRISRKKEEQCTRS